MVVAPDGGVGMVGAGRPHGMDALWSHASMDLCGWIRSRGPCFAPSSLSRSCERRATNLAESCAHHSSAGELVGSSPSPPAPRRKVSRLRFQPPPRGGGAARELEHRAQNARTRSQPNALCVCLLKQLAHLVTRK